MTREEVEKVATIVRRIDELEDLERFLQTVGLAHLAITVIDDVHNNRFRELPNSIIDLIEPTLTEAIASELAKAKKQLEDL